MVTGDKKTVAVFGLGFVGLTTALGFAETGCRVFGIDVDRERKDTLRKGSIPFHEPHMEEVLRKHLDKNFFVTDSITEAVGESTYIFYCVGTPYGADGSADLSFLFSAIDSTLDAIQDERFRVLVTKSTIPPSTTAEKILPYIRGRGVRRNTPAWQTTRNFSGRGTAGRTSWKPTGSCWA